MHFNGFSSIFHEFLWSSKDHEKGLFFEKMDDFHNFHGNLWNSWDSYGFYVIFHGFSMIFMDFPLFFMNLYRFSSIFHQFLWSSKDHVEGFSCFFLGIPKIFLDFM